MNQDGQVNWSSKCVLIVEDDPVSMVFIKELLTPSGALVYEAYNAEDAIEILQSEKIDLVLMDIQLPGIDGYEATRKMKKIKSGIPVIAQTAYAMQEDQNKSMEAGCDDYISKPIEINELMGKLGRFLQ